MNANLLALLAAKFSSENSIPVDRITITRTEYDAIVSGVSALEIRANVMSSYRTSSPREAPNQSESLHAAICQAVALMNMTPSREASFHDAHSILRQALADYKSPPSLPSIPWLDVDADTCCRIQRALTQLGVATPESPAEFAASLESQLNALCDVLEARSRAGARPCLRLGYVACQTDGWLSSPAEPIPSSTTITCVVCTMRRAIWCGKSTRRSHESLIRPARHAPPHARHQLAGAPRAEALSRLCRGEPRRPPIRRARTPRRRHVLSAR